MKKNNKVINWENEKEDGVIKFFKVFISVLTFIFFCKSFEENNSFENIIGISTGAIYDYYILLVNSKNSNTVKWYAKIGIWIYSIWLFFSLAGSFGVIAEEQDYFILKLGVLNYFKIPDKIIFFTFMSILMYNIVEIAFKSKRINITSKGEK